jgi:hypothetical protein
MRLKAKVILSPWYLEPTRTNGGLTPDSGPAFGWDFSVKSAQEKNQGTWSTYRGG